MTMTGRCLCGEVTYEITGEPIASGELKTYTETGENDDGEYVYRRFCPECGSPIVSELVGPGILSVKVGTLDDTSAIAPTAEVWCVDRQPWVELPGMAISLEREG